MTKKLYVMTDGSALKEGNHLGGYGFLIREIDNEKPRNRDYFVASSYGSVGNNSDISQIEVIAVLQALRYVNENVKKGNIKSDIPVEIVTDSLRTKKIFDGTQFEVVEANISRWREIKHLTKDLNIDFRWIPSHQDDEKKYFENEEMKVKLYEYNDKVDYLAKKGLKMPTEKESLLDSFVDKKNGFIKDGYIDPHPELSRTRNVRDEEVITEIKGTMHHMNREERGSVKMAESQTNRADKFNNRFSKMLGRALNKSDDSQTEEKKDLTSKYKM